MKLNLLLLFLCFAFCTQAQKQNTLLQGKVVNERGEALPNTTVASRAAGRLTFTDSSGKYQFELPQKSIEVKFSFIGYEPQTLIVKSKGRDTINLNIQLETRFEPIGDVTINSSSMVRVHKKKSTNIFDFEFFEDNIVLLLSEGNSTYIRLITDNDSTVSELRVSNKSEKLFTDCYGKILLIRKDSVFPIRVFSSFLVLKDGYSIETFEKTVVPCMATTNQNIVTSDYGLHNKSLAYFIVNKKSQNKKLLYLINDKSQTTAVSDFYNEHLSNFNQKTTASGTNNQKSIGNIRKAQQNFDFYNMVLIRPIYHPIFNISDSLFIFDHLAGLVQVHSSNGALKRSLPIDYQKNKSWKELILIDYITKKVFVVFKEKTRIRLKLLNVYSGILTEGFVLQTHNYPEEAKVKNGMIYYLYQKNSAFTTFKALYKQVISN